MKNREIPLFGIVENRPKKPVAEHLVRACRTYREAVRLCIRLAGFPEALVADRLGMKVGSFNAILNSGGSQKRARYLNPDYFGVIQDMCGNTAISQFFVMEAAGQLNRQAVGGEQVPATQKQVHGELADALVQLQKQVNTLSAQLGGM